VEHVGGFVCRCGGGTSTLEALGDLVIALPAVLLTVFEEVADPGTPLDWKIGTSGLTRATMSPVASK
jgi:hypothetical protein